MPVHQGAAVVGAVHGADRAQHRALPRPHQVAGPRGYSNACISESVQRQGNGELVLPSLLLGRRVGIWVGSFKLQHPRASAHKAGVALFQRRIDYDMSVQALVIHQRTQETSTVRYGSQERRVYRGAL